jgi:peroxiredoxin
MMAFRKATAAVPLLAFAALIGPPLRAAAFQAGEKVPNFQLKDTNGKDHSLFQYAGNFVVLEFWSFKCPVSLAYRERMRELESRFRPRGVVFLAIESNRNETPAEVARNAENLKMSYPVLLDTDGTVAERMGATHAPSVFILDRSGVLRYRGAIDNNRMPGQGGRVAYAEDALDALLAGRAVPTPETREFGCTIRRSAY